MMVADRRALLNNSIETIPLTFTRGSVTYDQYGNSVPVNEPRFNHRVPDVTVTNLLTRNQSDGGDTLNPELLTLNQRTGTGTLSDTTGFTGIGTTPGVISSSTEQAHSGTRSCKVVTAGDGAGEGVKVNATTIANATAYVGGAWVYAPAGATMEISQYTNAESTPVAFTGTGAWQWVDSGSVTSGTTTSEVWVKTKTTGQAITFYVDDLRLGLNTTTGFGTIKGDEVISVTGETSKTGYRSIKVVTDGSHVGEGETHNVTVVTNQPYIYTVNVKAPLGATMEVASSSGATTSFTGTGAWQTVSLLHTITSGTTDSLRVRTLTSAQAITFYLDQCMLETSQSGVVHDWAYGGSSYSSYKTTQGCLVEEGKTNLFTANQSTCTDTSGDTTGFSAAGTGTVISSSTEQSIQGSRSLKVVTTGSVYNEGVATTPVTVSASTVYNFSALVKADLGVILVLQADYWNEVAWITGNGSWQLIQFSKTSGAGTSIPFRIRTATAQATTFYVDMLQVTATSYPLSWGLGGVAISAESLTAPSSVLGLTEGTIELETYANSVIKTNSLNNYLLDMADGSANNRIFIADDSSNNLTVSTKASAAATAVSYADSNLTLNTWYKIGTPYNSTYLKQFLNGTSVGTPLTSVNLPATANNMYLGSKYDASSQANTIFRNVTISKPKRADTDITNRASKGEGVGFGTDRQVSLVAPLTQDLKAYRVRA